MTDLYLVRHGETEWNRLRRIQGLTDIPLNDTGREQARRTGMLLTRRPIARVYASPLGRARETAEIIARELGLSEPELRDALVERNYGAAEGMSFHEIDVTYPPGSEVPGRESRLNTLLGAPASRRLKSSPACGSGSHNGWRRP